MELVFAILAALILFKWLQTGEIWGILGALVTGIALLTVVLLIVANTPAWGLIIILSLCAAAIIAFARKRGLMQRAEAELRRKYPNPNDRYEAWWAERLAAEKMERA